MRRLAIALLVFAAGFAAGWVGRDRRDADRLNRIRNKDGYEVSGPLDSPLNRKHPPSGPALP